MTDRKLRKALLEKLGVSPQRLSQRVKALKRASPMSTEDATYCIAFKEGISLDRFLPRDVVDRVRGLIGQLHDGAKGLPSTVRTKTVIRTRELRIGGETAIDDPVLPEKVLNEAQQMAGKVYPMLYIFENSVREVISLALQNSLGPNWWETVTPLPVKRNVGKRMAKEDEDAWHGKRGVHPIFYTDIEDLISIVRVERAWQVLEPILGRQDWFSNLVRSIAASRNVVAHMNPLGDEDIARLKVNFRDWQKQIRAKRSLIPGSGILPRRAAITSIKAPS